MLTEKYPDAKWTKPFIATGQLALTLYVAHLVVSKWLLKELEAADIYAPVWYRKCRYILYMCGHIFSFLE